MFTLAETEGIRTLDRALQPYNGLANRRLQPLGHVSKGDKSLNLLVFLVLLERTNPAH